MKKHFFCVVVSIASLVMATKAEAQPENLRQELDASFQKGMALRKQGKNAEAILFFEKAVTLAPKVFGPDHLNTAALMSTLGASYRDSGRLKEAALHFRRCLEIREAKLGKEDLKLTITLSSLGSIYLSMGQYKEAEKHFRRCLAISEAKLPPNHHDLANSLNNLATLLHKAGSLEEAENFLKRSLNIQEALSAKDDLQLGSILNNLGLLYRDMSRFAEAEPLIRRSLDITERKLGSEDPKVTSTLNNLGLLYKDLGHYGKAEALFRRSLESRENTQGKNHPSVAVALNNLALLYSAMGRFREAEPLYRRSLDMRQAQLEKDHPEVATSLNNLAGLYRALGRTAEAETYFRRALEIREAKFGSDHPEVANTLDNLAGLCHELGRYKEAEALFLRCLKINQDRLGKDHLAVALNLHNLGHLCSKMKRHKDAELLYRRSLHIREARLGKDHPDVAVAWNNLGTLFWDMGRLQEARDHLQRGLEIAQAKIEKNHPGTAISLLNLAGIHQALKQSDRALQLHEQCLQINQANLQNVFAFSSEATMHSYLDTMSGVLPITLNLAFQADQPGPAAEMALTWTLRLKGTVLDTLCRYRQAQHLVAPNNALAQRVDRYRSLKQLQANAALTPPRGLSPEQSKQQLAVWAKETEELEAELNRTFAKNQPEGVGDSEAINTAALQKRLAPETALIEFIRAPLRDFKAALWLKHHYFAFVLSSGRNPPQLIDLGEAKAIDDGVVALRQQFADFQEKLKECESAEEARDLERTQEKQFRKVSAALHARLMAPLQKALGQARLVYLAADGELNRLPFEALVDETGNYLVENYRFAYQSSGRDLLRPSGSSARGTVVFAGPDYKLDATQRQAQAEKLLAKKEVVASRTLPSQEVRSVGWKSLPGAAAEAKDIHQLMQEGSFGPVKAYVGAEALEEVLKTLPAPRILHLATHGFFLDHQPEAPVPAENGAGAGWARGRLKHLDNPLLRSGIVLAGANTIGDKDSSARVEDGWVTAEEIALLNLRGTELVVLSACQTGLGDVKTGEGVYGLRRAFLYAGARTLVTSLFEVPDRETRDLMLRFYGGLKAGQGKLAALHAAQRETVRQRRQTQEAAHPFFWASFVLVGDPE